MDEAISDSLSYTAPAMMLYGFSIENLMKGVVVAREPDRIVRDRKNLFVRFNHDLCNLSQELDLSLSDVEEDLVRRLTTFATWAGRYPTATKSDHMRPYDRAAGFEGPARWSSEDLPLIKNLLQRLRDLLTLSRWLGGEGA